MHSPNKHPSTDVQRRMTEAFHRAIALLLISASLLLLVGQYTDLDLMLADAYFDPQQHTFPWKHAWFATTFMHGWVKNALMVLGLAFVGAAVADLLMPLKPLSPVRRAQLRIVALASLIVPAAINLLKRGSSLHCPWSIDRYGGHEPFLRLFDWAPEGWHAGHCFPAGHATTGMWLAALAVFWLPQSPRKAGLVFLAGIGIEIVLGWVQQMRGAHFLTHTLWTIWVSCALLLALIVIFSRPLFSPPSNPPSPTSPPSPATP